MTAPLPAMPSPQAPAVAMPAGTLHREWFLLLQGLLAALAAQEARITVLEKK